MTNSDDGYVCIDGNISRESISGELQDISAEQQIHTNMVFSCLTSEAKFVLYAIFQTPGELSKMLFKNKPTVYKIKKYLRLMGWSIPETAKVIKELRVFSNDIITG